MVEVGRKSTLNSLNSIVHLVILSNRPGLWSIQHSKHVVNALTEYARKYAIVLKCFSRREVDDYYKKQKQNINIYYVK